MKTRKLMAVLVMVALFVTALPVVALGAEEVDEVKADVDYVAKWSETIDRWCVEVTPKDKLLNKDTIGTAGYIKVVMEAGKELDEPRELDPDTDAVLWFAVAEGDRDLSYREDGIYRFEVLAKNAENTTEDKYTFEFDYDSSKVKFPKSELAAVAGRIYANDDEYDIGDKVALKFQFSDEYGFHTENVATGTFFVWAEREKDELSAKDIPNKPVDVTEDKAKEFWSYYPGKVTYYLGKVKTPNNKISDPTDFRKLDSVTVEFVEDAKEYQIKLETSKSDLIENADGTSSIEVKFQVVDKRGFPVPKEQVNFDTSSSRLILNKDSAETNSSGIAKVKATSERAGKYRLYAELDSDSSVEYKEGDEVGLELEFIASSAYDIKVKKGNGVVIALDEPYTFEFEIFDIFGRVIKGGEKLLKDDKKDDKVEVKVTDAPDKAKFKDHDDWDWAKGNFKVKAAKNALNKEGDYVLRVKLNNGKYATAKFEVKKQGKIVDMELKYDPAYAAEKSTGMPTVKLIDADGVEAEIDGDHRDLEFAVSDTRLAEIEKDGTVSQRDDKEGVVVVTVTHTKHKLVATAEVRIGDLGLAGVEFDVPEELLIDEEYTVKMKVRDEDGYEVMKDADYEVIVLDEPEDAKVGVDVDGKEFTILSDTKGEVKLIAIAREEDKDKAVSGTLTLNFLDESKPDVIGAEKVTVFVDQLLAVVDGETVQLDKDLGVPFIDAEEGRTYVPFRFLGETFGAEVDWEAGEDGRTAKVFLVRDDMEVVVGIGDEFAMVTKDDEVFEVSFEGLGAARVVEEEGRTYLPFRALAKVFGLEDENVKFGPEDGKVEWVSFEQ